MLDEYLWIWVARGFIGLVDFGRGWLVLIHSLSIWPSQILIKHVKHCQLDGKYYAGTHCWHNYSRTDDKTPARNQICVFCVFYSSLLFPPSKIIYIYLQALQRRHPEPLRAFMTVCQLLLRLTPRLCLWESLSEAIWEALGGDNGNHKM